MKHCVGCGANLRFDIPTQMMKCDYCGSTVEPETIDAEDSKMADFFDMMVYQCNNCYGEVVADENEAAVFCPYCGDTTILAGRMTKIAKPKYIIPFQKTKQECVQSYKSLLNKSIYAPSKLRKEGVTETFRGIYMPYWSYSETQNKVIQLRGEKIKTNLISEDVTEYQCDYEVHASYDGLCFDASKVFDDDLSLAIAPFDANARKEFCPGYISGFYADTYDVDAKQYRDKAELIATDEVVANMAKDVQFKKMNMKKLNSVKDVNNKLETATTEENVAYHPVWFMATRFGERLSYATINGQTGKAAAIIPASPVKYVLFSLVTAIPIFLIINLFSLLRPDMAAMFVNLLALFVYLIYDKELSILLFREASSGVKKYVDGKDVKAKSTKTHKVICTIFTLALAAALGIYVAALTVYYSPALIVPVNFVVVVAIILLMGISIIGQVKQNDLTKHRYLYLCIPIVGLLILIVEIVNPASDSFYYVMIILQMLSTAITFIDLIHYHNIIATKPMPQFERTGGDDRAK